jgi:N-carbamoylputrescine amidase
MTNAAKTKIALIQMRCSPKPDENFSRAIEFIRASAQKGAQIVCLPELFRSQYFCQTEDHKNFDLAEEVPGKSTSVLAEVA